MNIIYKLQLTNGYNILFDQITRILQYAQQKLNQKQIPRQEFLTELGMSKRQFENLSSIAVGLGLTKPRVLVLTHLGKTIAEQDIFFDNLNTLWIVHYVICSEPKWVVWHRLLNQVILENEKINIDIALPYFTDLKTSYSEKTIKSKLPSEILSVLNAYGEQKFSTLHILTKTSIGKYIRNQPVPVDPVAFLFCLLHFRDQYFPNATGLVIENILDGFNSPGRLLFQPHHQIKELIAQLHDQHYIRIENFGDLDQIRFANGINKEFVMNQIYGIE